MVPGQHDALDMPQRDPASRFDALARLVNHQQVKCALVENPEIEADRGADDSCSGVAAILGTN